MPQSFFDRLFQTEQILKDKLPEARSENYELSLKTIGVLKQFVASCKWNDTEKTRLMMRNIHRRAVDAAKICQVSPNTVRSARSQASKKLFQMFGENIFDKIIVGDSEACKDTQALICAMLYGYDQIDNYVPDSILRQLELKPSNSDAEFTLEELEDVITFLRQFDLIKMQKQFENLDQAKLMYVFEVLKSDLISNDSDHRVNTLKLSILKPIMRGNKIK